MSKPAIEVTGLSKVYRIGEAEEEYDTLAGRVLSVLRSPAKNLRRLRSLSDLSDKATAANVIWALKDVNLEIQRGSVVGLVGANGAGKSTLLKVLSRITPPTEGRVVMNGRVGSLLEVGTGFHGDLTGRENIFLNGVILGMKPYEIRQRLDDIVSFAGVEGFVDTPVKRYSSGMYLRLAFAVAAHLDTEILLVDEVLAVGDVAFQRRCLGKMEELADGGRTVILVSHNLAAVNDLCSTTALVEKGMLIEVGRTADVLERYLRLQGSIASEWVSSGQESDGFRVLEARVLSEAGDPRSVFPWDEEIRVRIDYEILRPLVDFRVGFEIEDRLNQLILRSCDSDWLDNIHVVRQPGRYTTICRLPRRFFNRGDYFLSLRCDVPNKKWVCKVDRVVRFAVGQSPHAGGKIPRAALRPHLEWSVAGPDAQARTDEPREVEAAKSAIETSAGDPA